MPTTHRTLDELSSLGQQIYDEQVSAAVGPHDEGKFVAIDVESSDFEIDSDDYDAVAHLRVRKPAADIWLMRVGHRTAYRIGISRR